MRKSEMEKMCGKTTAKGKPETGRDTPEVKDGRMREREVLEKRYKEEV